MKRCGILGSSPRTSLIRARLAAVRAVRAARQQLSGFLLRHERTYGAGRRAWTKAHRVWLADQSFTQPAQHETFNVLKTGGYNLEHNFGHGKQTLASVLVVLNLIAFAFHIAARLAVLAWREAVAARGATYRFFEHLRTVTVYVVFQNWDHLLRSIAAAAIRPP
jgi:hypothetical protein